MSLKNQKGVIGIDIAISIVVLFIFVTIIAVLSYQSSSTSKEIELQAKATSIAVDKIEQMKALNFDDIKNRSEANGNSNYQILQEEPGQEGFFSEIVIQDYADLEEGAKQGIVKKVTVRVKYMFKAQEQTIELSTILSI